LFGILSIARIGYCGELPSFTVRVEDCCDTFFDTRTDPAFEFTADAILFFELHCVVSMSSVAKIINRNESFDDDDVPNKWKWEWLSKTVTIGDVKERVGEHFRKQSSVKQRDIAFTDD
jgi:hypothetical protein